MLCVELSGSDDRRRDGRVHFDKTHVDLLPAAFHEVPYQFVLCPCNGTHPMIALFSLVIMAAEMDVGAQEVM
jgi:hypothetical protein